MVDKNTNLDIVSGETGFLLENRQIVARINVSALLNGSTDHFCSAMQRIGAYQKIHTLHRVID